MKGTEGEIAGIQTESYSTHLRVLMVMPAVYDGPQETTGS